MALGCCHRDNYALIPEELHSLNKDFTADRKVPLWLTLPRSY